MFTNRDTKSTYKIVVATVAALKDVISSAQWTTAKYVLTRSV